MKIIISFILSIVLFNIAYSQTINLNGFVDTYHAVRVNDPYDFLSSRTRLRTEVKGYIGNSSFFASLNAIENTFDPSLTKIELREAYLDYRTESWNLRAGRQILTWGQADGVWITDLISPWDFTEFMAQDFDDIRIPVNAIKFKYYKNNFSNELVYVTSFEPFVLAKQGSPWAFTGGIPENTPTVLMPANEPDKTFNNGEIANRATMYSSLADFSLVAMYTWNKLPVFQVTPNDTGLTVNQYHSRLPVVGFDFTTTIGAVVVRGEAAMNFNELYQSSADIYMVKRNSANMLIGADWLPSGGWMISLQLYNKTIIKHSTDIMAKKETYLATYMISKKLLRNTLTLSSNGFYDIDNETFFGRTCAEYSLSDPIKIIVGYDAFIGTQGMYGQFHNNDEVWLKLKYSF